jgi:hypothetical protein
MKPLYCCHGTKMPMLLTARRVATRLAAAAAAAAVAAAASLLPAGIALATAGPAQAAARHAQAGSGSPADGGSAFTVRQILSGKRLRHSFRVAGSGKLHSAPLAQPDDITKAGPYLFTGFQNGVGPQGETAPGGNRDSTIVEFTRGGHVVRQWDVRGKCDGLTADPARHQVIATVNEDAHSSVYTIDPWASPARQVRHYAYSEPCRARAAPMPSPSSTAWC